jgi:intein/homing endonuclease
MAQKHNKKKEQFNDPFKELRDKINSEAVLSPKIPNIIEFIESKKYLGFPYLNPPIQLYDLQMLILKCFYRGSVGNENLTLTEKDLQLIEKHDLNNPENGAILDKWNNKKEFKELVLVWGRRCLSEDVEILDCQTGKMWRLGDLWNYGKEKVSTWTYDEKRKTMLVMDDCPLVFQGKKEVYKIETDSGHEIEATEDHLFLTNNGWTKVKDLKNKTKIAIAASQPFFGSSNEITENEASFLGYLTGNNCDSTGGYVSTSLKEGALFNDFKESIYGITRHVAIEPSSLYNIKTDDNKKYNYVVKQKATIHNFPLETNIIDVLLKNGLKNKIKTNKAVPSRIFTSPKRIISSYLRSLFSSDGIFVSSKNKKNSFKIQICLGSKETAKQIQHLLSRFGIFSQYKFKLIDFKAEHLLSISKNSYVKKFVDEIGIIGDDEFCKNVAEQSSSENLQDPIFVSVQSLKKIGTKRTFDIQVSNNVELQNFVANGFITHNCVSGDGLLVDARTGERFTFKQAWEGDKTISSWTYDENQKKMVIVDDCAVSSQGREVVYKVASQYGHEIEVTANHQFLTQRGWVECKNLRTGDKLAFPSSCPIFGTSSEITENEAALLGYITGDGRFLQDVIYFTAKSDEIKQDFESKLDSFSDNLELIHDELASLDNKKVTYKIRSKETDCTYSTRDENDFTKLLIKHDLINKTSDIKRVPEALWKCPKNVIAAYLKALFSCNGLICGKKVRDKHLPFVGFFTIDKLQAQNIQSLLHKFGIIANIRERKQKTKTKDEGKLHQYDSINYEVSFTKNLYVLQFINEINSIDQDSVDYVRDLAEIINKKESTEIVYVKFRSRTELEEKEVYDLQVSHDPYKQNFTLGGAILHNSGKDFVSSIIALYEAMRLLESPEGNPYKLYNLASASPFTILTVANSAPQAKVLFNEIKNKVMHSEYFKDKVLPGGVTGEGIYFLTPEDKKNNEILKEKNFPLSLGSVFVRAGHSNSDSLAGISCFVLLLDEIGLYKNTAGSSSGDAIFNNLAPSTTTYNRYVPLYKDGHIVVDDDGKPKMEKISDGKIICLSTPRSKDGIFYELYSTHMEVPNRLMCRAATWQVSPTQTKEWLMAKFPTMPEEKFRMEFGAEFSGTAGENFFSLDLVDYCFRDSSLKERQFGLPGIFYFAHLDPAVSSHNYALVLAHKDVFFDPQEKKRDWRIVVDHIKYWSPSPGNPISVEEVDNYICDLNSKFCLGLVTYDHFNSQESIAKLRKRGVPTKMTPYTKAYKNIIYDHLSQLVISKRLCIPHHLLLQSEMRNLQRKWLSGGGGFKVYPKKDGDVTTDDVCDALAGACYNCVEREQNRSARGILVSLPVQGNNDIVWRSMQGVPYGVGPGNSVAKRMEERNPYYRGM